MSRGAGAHDHKDAKKIFKILFDAQVTEEKQLLTSIVRNTQGDLLSATPYAYP